MKTISYTISVYNEIDEFCRLVDVIKSAKSDQDEIVVVHTFKNSQDQTTDVFRDIKNFCLKNCEVYENFHFENKFFELKNRLNNLASKEFIVNLDADELVSIETLKLWQEILSNNHNDLYYVPRINTIIGYTLKDLQEYKWVLNGNQWIDWPDYQPRIIQNNSKIQWIGNVHESLIGHENSAMLPQSPSVAILHHKHINKQRNQNQLYKTISNDNNSK